MSVAERTHLLQITTGDISEAPRILKEARDGGQPIVVVVENSFCWCKIKLDVPSGVTVLAQRWGAHDGELAPGMKCWFCKFRRVAAIITMNSVRYDAPIKNWPTKDNVRVGVDISLTFRIGPGHDECMKFIYELGPAKLDEMLAAESEEAIRNFVHSVRLSQIQDIKGEIASTLLTDLNKKFVEFGVFFENVQILQIKIPDQLQKSLSDTTAYDIKLQNQIKRHQNDMLVLENSENQKLTELQRTNMRKIEEIKAKKNIAMMSRDEQKVNAMSDYEVRLTAAEQRASVLMTKVKGEKDIVENETKKQVLEMINDAEIDAALKKSQADQDASIIETRAEAEIANMNIIEATRKHQLIMAKAEVLQELSRRAKIIISGKTGDNLLKEIIE